MRQLDVALGYVRNFPEIAPYFLGFYRRYLIAGFPYGIFYTLEGNRVIITAVMDLRQSPEMIRKRLGGWTAASPKSFRIFLLHLLHDCAALIACTRSVYPPAQSLSSLRSRSRRSQRRR